MSRYKSGIANKKQNRAGDFCRGAQTLQRLAAENDAKKVCIELTKAELAEIEKVTRAKFASKQSEEDRNALLADAEYL